MYALRQEAGCFMKRCMIVLLLITALTLAGCSAAPKFIEIKGVEFRTALTVLRVTFQDLRSSNIEPLEYMKSLAELDLGGNQIKDMGDLKGLRNLKVLGLGGNRIGDISVLKDLKKLTWLDLSNNQISDIRALSGLINLWKLDLIGNPLSKAQINELKTPPPRCLICF